MINRLNYIALLILLFVCSSVFGGRVFDFGEVVRGSKVSNSFQIINSEKVPLKITRVRPLCTCVKILNYTKSILPGATGEVSLLFNSAKLYGRVSYSIVVHTENRSKSKFRLEIRASIVDDISVSPMRLDLSRALNNNKKIPLEIFVYSRSGKKVPKPEILQLPNWLEATVLDNKTNFVISLIIIKAPPEGLIYSHIKFSLGKGKEYKVLLRGNNNNPLSPPFLRGNNKKIPLTLFSRRNNRDKIQEGINPLSPPLRFDISTSSMTGTNRGNSGIVYINFFFSPNCKKCEEVSRLINFLETKFSNRLKINQFDLQQQKNYELLCVFEDFLDIRKNSPLAVFIGSNSFYGAKTILSGLENAVKEGILSGGVEDWQPSTKVSAKKLVNKRFESFTLAIVLAAGLADGINPCAFATLILFVSMLAVYRRSARDIMVTAIVFALGVMVTYTLLGIFLFSAINFAERLIWLKTGIYIIFGVVCFVLAILSGWDVWQSLYGGKEKKFLLKLPDNFRKRIHDTFHKHAGRKMMYTGIFSAGVIVSLLESVCTGQLYVPTLALMAGNSPTRLRAIILLVLYNIMFIIPLLVLAGIVAFGARTSFLINVFEKYATVGRIIQTVIFLIIGIGVLIMV